MTVPLHDHDWTDYIELVDGVSELPEWRNLPEWQSIYAGCDVCYTTVHRVGRYRYSNDPISLDDGTTTTFEDWDAEVRGNRLGRKRFRKFWCPSCETVTDHTADRK